MSPNLMTFKLQQVQNTVSEKLNGISLTLFELQSGNENFNATANAESVITAIALLVLHTGKLKRNLKFLS